MLIQVTVCAVLVLGLAQRVFAGCTCGMPGGDCGRGWSSGQVIFLGKVTADIETQVNFPDLLGPAGKVSADDSEAEEPKISLEGPAKIPPMNHEVHFLIAESFRGDAQAGHETVVHTGMDERGPQDGDCSYPFVVGVSYLVYASDVGGSISTSVCTLTSPEVVVGGVLRELRAIRDGQAVDRLFGTVSLLSPKAEPWALWVTKKQPLAEVTVRAIDSSGLERSTKTDEHGVYAFEWLPPGLMRALSDRADEALTVDLTDEDATRVGCRADIPVRRAKQISGTLGDFQGRRIIDSRDASTIANWEVLD